MENGYYWVRRKGGGGFNMWEPAQVGKSVVVEIGLGESRPSELYDIGPRIPQYVPDDKSKTAEYPPVELDITVEEG